MPNEWLAIFLLNVSKEALFDFLNESRLLNKPTNLTKNKMIELFTNDWVITTGNSILTYLQIIQKDWLSKIHNSVINKKYNEINKSKVCKWRFF